MRFIFPDSWYVRPVRITTSRDPQTGMQQPGQRAQMPRALFAPGASTEEGLLSEVARHTGRLFFEDPVEIESTDSVEIDTPAGVQRWSVDGHPRYWPLGTEVVIQLAS